MRNILILLVSCLLASCTKKDPLAGKTFFLSEPGLQAMSTIVLQFPGNKEVEIIMLNDISKSVNSYTRVPYQLEGDIFSFQGTSYKIESNNDGFDLYNNEVLKYKLLATTEDLAGRLIASPLLKKSK